MVLYYSRIEIFRLLIRCRWFQTTFGAILGQIINNEHGSKNLSNVGLEKYFKINKPSKMMCLQKAWRLKKRGGAGGGCGGVSNFFLAWVLKVTGLTADVALLELSSLPS
jgi:hypothetical protein